MVTKALQAGQDRLRHHGEPPRVPPRNRASWRSPYVNRQHHRRPGHPRADRGARSQPRRADPPGRHPAHGRFFLSGTHTVIAAGFTRIFSRLVLGRSPPSSSYGALRSRRTSILSAVVISTNGDSAAFPFAVEP